MIDLDRIRERHIREHHENAWTSAPDGPSFLDALDAHHDRGVLLDEVERLRETISEFLDAISGVPMRAIDCNQEEVYRLQHKLEKATGERR